MKRAIIVGAGTVAGLATVLVLNPDDPSLTASTSLDSGEQSSSGTSGSGSAGSSSTSESSSGSTSSEPSSGSGTSSDSSSSSSAASSEAGSASGTYTGSEIQVRSWGVVQVEVTVSDGRVTDVTTLQAPDWDQRSAMISSHAVPVLESQAVDMQSATIAGVSGATFTSRGFAQSLQSALAKAGLG